MAFRLVMDVFSGRSNPVIDLEDGRGEALIAETLAFEAVVPRGAAAEPLPRLGYRGVLLEEVGLPVARRYRLPIGDRSGEEAASRRDPLDELLYGATGLMAELGPDLARVLEPEVRALRRTPARMTTPLNEAAATMAQVAIPGCNCAPVFEPLWWNDGSTRQLFNNCYNYSTNYRTDTFAQPGRAAGSPFTAFICASVRAAALRDQLNLATGLANECPDEGHLVALVVAPGIDFHWYRKGPDGFWSHKPGPTAVTNLDNSGQLIADPRTADRGMYTSFCGFMIVRHGHIKIQ